MNQLEIVQAACTTFRTRAILATGIPPGERLAELPAFALNRLRSFREDIHGAVTASTPARGRQRALAGHTVEAFVSILDQRDFQAGEMLSEWLDGLRDSQHQAVLAKHGQWFRPAGPSAHSTWVERLQSSLPASMAAHALVGGAITAAAVTTYSFYSAGKSGAPGSDASSSLKGCFSKAVTGSKLVPLSAAALSTVPLAKRCLFGSDLPQAAYRAAVAATDMDQAFAILRCHMLQQYDTSVRQPLQAALADIQQLAATPEQRGELAPVIASNLTEAAAGVAVMIAHITALCTPSPA